MEPTRPLTTRRGFIAGASFGVVSLYGLWAGLGAAPLGLPGGDETGGGDYGSHAAASEPGASAGHGGHGAVAAGLEPEEFRRLTQAFVERFRLDDGSVRPVAAGSAHVAGSHAGSHEGADHPAPSTDPVEVYVMAFQWGFAPSVLRLEAGVPYRFRMMAVDVSHGASIRLGPASRIVRLRRDALVEQEVTFREPGDYLLYCTVYCGLAHDRMAGRIVVA